MVASVAQPVYTPFEVIDQAHATLYETFKARKCLPLEYRRQQLYALARLCQENADALFAAVFKDLGKPKLEFLAFELGSIVQRSLLCAERLEQWAASEKVTEGVPEWQLAWSPTVYRVPKGPVLIIAPWNYPLVLSLQPLYSAISAGCPAVVKPSELVPTYSILLAQLLPKYLDPSAYVVVNGGVPETTRLLDMRWAHIFYTGNGKVGRIIAAAAAKHLTPVSLELGGKSPCYVDADTTDLRVAASRILFGKCANSGQTCVAPDYVLVQREAQEKLVAALRQVLDERYPEGALNSDSYGRIVNAPHFNRLRSLLQASKGKIVIGGDMVAERLKFAPTVVTDVFEGDSLMSEEIFGPILPIVPVSSLSDAINFVNARDNPLAFYVFTEDPVVRRRLLEETLSGSLVFNDTFDQLAVAEMPFSGIGESGYGTQVMRYGFDAFTHLRSSENVPLSMEPNLGMRYAPYTREKVEFMGASAKLAIPSA